MLSARKGQVSLEYLTIAIFLLLIIGILFVYSNTLASTTINNNLAYNSTIALANAVDQVYALGPGSKLIVDIELPQSIIASSLDFNQVSFTLREANLYNEFYKGTSAPLIGKLPSTPGRHAITVEMLDSGSVKLGAGLLLSPGAIIATVQEGTSSDKILTVFNFTDQDVSGITFSVSGDAANFVSLSSLPTSLLDQASDAITVSLTIPADTPAQTSTAFLDVNTTEGFVDQALVTLTVPQSAGTVTLATFNDAAYAVPDFDFARTNTIYYSVAVTDQADANITGVGLDVNILQPSGGTIYSLSNQAVTDGIFLDSFDSNAEMDAGSYTIQATMNYFGTASDSIVFTLDSNGNSGNSGCFYFDWSTSNFVQGGKNLTDWNMGNTCDGILVITKMTVSQWSVNDQDNALLEHIELNDDSVFNNGNATDGTEIDITDFGIPAFSSFNVNNVLDFTQKINDDGEDFIITFEFLDSTTYTTVLYNP
jgi:hypothetical protein